jgi:16S rRNA (guanine1207-N2)-methyltransferase
MNDDGDGMKRRPEPARPAEQRALNAALGIAGDRILCTTAGRAQAACELSRQRATAQVCCWFLDQHLQRLAASSGAAELPNLALPCQADAPADEFDLAVLPLSAHGEAELARDLMQTACQRLRQGGTLVASVDNPRDRWVHDQLTAWFSKVTVQTHEDAVVYVARKRAEPRKWKDFRCEFAFRDRGRLVRAVSRPGVFSHRRIDAGARQLLAAADVRPGARVLDIGCGAGVVGLALAAREPSAAVYAVDSNARAVACAAGGAALNGLDNVTAALNSTGEYCDANSFDLAVANPPYYADFRIAELFLRAAHRSLRDGGRLLVVTKDPDWYGVAMTPRWDQVECLPSKRYHVVSAIKRFVTMPAERLSGY